MGTNVLELIKAAAPKKGATSAEILALSSGTSSRSTATRRKSTSSSKSPTKAATKKKTSSSGRTKKPCKYGPRDAAGYCPKKPNNPYRQTSGNRTKVTARTGTSATTQAIDVVTNPRASKEQKAQAVTKAVEATATQGLKAGAKKAVKSGPVQRAKASAVSIAKKIPVGGVLGPFVTAAQQVISKMPSESEIKSIRHARVRADAALKATEKKMKTPLTKKQRNILHLQLIDHFRRNP